jgi:O-antigen/teichoic acid export membrane protein
MSSRPNEFGVDPIDEQLEADTGAPPGLEPGPPEQASLLRRLAQGTGWQALSQTLPLVFNLALTPFIIHGLGVELYGIFLLVAVIQQFVSSVDGGIGPGARRYFGIHAGKDDRIATTSLLVTLLVLIGASSLVVCGLAFWAAPEIMAFFPGAAADPAGATFLLRVMIVIVAVAQARSLFTQVLWTSNKFQLQAAGDLLGFFVYATGMVITVVNGYGLIGIGCTLIAQQALSTLIVVPAAMLRLDRAGMHFVPRSLLKEFFTFAWKIQLSGIMSLVSQQGDALFVGRFAAPQMTSFGTGASFAATLRGMPMNASTPMEANIVRALGALGPEGAAGEAAKIQRIWARLIAGWIAVGVPAAGFGVNAWLHLGTDLPGQVASVVLLAYGVSLMMLIQRFWINALGRSGLTLSHDIINTVLNLGLTVPLILSFGALGTVTATLVAAVVAAVYLTVIGQRRVAVNIPTPWSQVSWLWVLAAAVASAGTTWAAAHFLTGSIVPLGPLSLLTIGLAAAPVLLLYLVQTVGLRRSRELLATIMRRR